MFFDLRSPRGKAIILEPDSCTTDFKFNDVSYQVNFEQVYNIAEKILSFLNLADFEISIDFTSPAEIRELNQSYRQKDKSTDVLSFPQQEWEKCLTLESPFQSIKKSEIPQLLGDIVISLADAEENAVRIGQTLDREVCFLIIHGILHLCGHDHIDPNEETIMLRQQELILAKLTSEPPPVWKNCVRSKT